METKKTWVEIDPAKAYMRVTLTARFSLEDYPAAGASLDEAADVLGEFGEDITRHEVLNVEVER